MNLQKTSNNLIDDNSGDEDEDDFAKLEEMFSRISKPYCREFKIKVVEFLLSHDIPFLKTKARKLIITRFQIPKQTLSDWEKSYIKFKTNIAHKGGRRSSLIYIEKDVVNWVLHNSKLGNAVTIKSICNYIYSLNSYYRKFNFNSMRHKILRLLTKYNLINHKISKIEQPLPERKELIPIYLCNIVNIRKNLRINDNKKHLIVNCDEIVLYYENPEINIIDISEHKELIINPENNAFKRISVILTICADGTKLEPFVIFQIDNMMDYDMLSNSITKKENIYISYQYNGWCDEQIFLDWYENIFLLYEKNKAKEACLLILDKSPSHFNEEVLDELNDNNTYYVFIPRGFTKSLQPMDIGVSETFKKAFKEKYNNDKINGFNSTQNKRLFPENHKDIITNIINEIWWGEDIISKELIINSFQKAGITLKIYGSENKEWKFPQSMIDTGNIYNNTFENVNNSKKDFLDLNDGFDN